MTEFWQPPPLPQQAWRFESPEDEGAFEARCAHWESLTEEDIWGPGGRPPLPLIPPPPVGAR